MEHDDTHPKDCWSRTPHYRPGGKLSAEQLNASQADAVMRDRLVNVAMHGVGVAYGYQIKTDEHGHIVIDDGCIEISCGLAFDTYGRMLFWRGGRVSMRDIIGHKPDCEGLYTLSVHYAEKSDQGGPFDPCHEGTEWVDRCVVFALHKGCATDYGCAPDVPEDACMTRHEWACLRNGTRPGVVPMDDELSKACAEIPKLSASHCGRVSFDPNAGLPLSCLNICNLDREKDDCDPRFGFCPCSEAESCAVRPVAYRNPLLREMINLDDVPLAKIKSYSWSGWRMEKWGDAYRVPFGAFKRRVTSCRKGERAHARDGFSVMFTRPVQRDTLHPLSVIMGIHIRENRPYYWKPMRIPIEVVPLDRDENVVGEDDPVECVWGLLICPLEDWITYELIDKNSTILDCANRGQLARIEITLRGQIIRDCCGLMIDARPPDIDEGDPCNNRAGHARPGGDWISVFRIGPDAPHGHGYDDEKGESDEEKKAREEKEREKAAAEKEREIREAKAKARAEAEGKSSPLADATDDTSERPTRG
ncbi:MAG: hypothetical protein ABJQ34_04650 [Paracoccaceae bacterium]